MSTFLKPILLAGLVLAALAAWPAAAAEGIAWSDRRPLTWADFRGPVKAGASDENVAATAASLSWSYAYEFELSVDGCSYRVTEINAEAVFHPDQSWVKPDHRTARVLEHEQGHFDITQIHKQLFEKAAGEFVGSTGRCAGRSERRIASFVEKEVKRSVGALYDQVWRIHTSAQNNYDAETLHGTNRPAQHSWLERIAAGLEGRWQGL